MECKRRKTEVKEEDDLTFSYDLVRPLFRKVNRDRDTEMLTQSDSRTWYVIEKGSKRSNLTERYKISYDIIKSAESLVKKHVKKATYDQLQSHRLRDMGFEILLREQLYHVTNSVKARGAVYSLLKLSDNQKRKGVITISKDSFAPSLCYFGNKFQIPVTVVVPISETDEETINVCRNLGATVLTQKHYIRNMVEAHKEALRIAKERGLVYIDGNDHPNVIIGQATLAIEVMEEVKNADIVILPASVYCCGLTASLAMAIKGYNPDVKVIEVQHAESADFSIDCVRRESMSPNELDIHHISEYSWHYSDTRGIVRSLFDSIVKVENTYVKDAVKFLLQKGNVTDFNVAIGLAAILSRQINESQGKRVLIPPYGKMDLSTKGTDNQV